MNKCLLLLTLTTQLFTGEYFIKDDYITRSTYAHFDDTAFRDECQDEVYREAKNLAKKNRLTTIADIGCGSAFKLLKYFRAYKTVGFEILPTLNFLRANYPNRQWGTSDFSQPLGQFDLILCSDVIEHLVNPDLLLQWINTSDFEYLVISTPDRDKLLQLQNNLQSQTGPPVNPAHVREWSFDEFSNYISSYFDIVSHFHTQREYWGQVIIAKKRG